MSNCDGGQAYFRIYRVPIFGEYNFRGGGSVIMTDVLMREILGNTKFPIPLSIDFGPVIGSVTEAFVACGELVVHAEVRREYLDDERKHSHLAPAFMGIKAGERLEGWSESAFVEFGLTNNPLLPSMAKAEPG